MIAEFTVVAVTMVADGGTQLRLQPVGEPGFRVLEQGEAAEDGTLGQTVVELNEGQRFIPRPGQSVRLQIRKVQASE